MNLHPIPPGLWCVPAAIFALTGADPESVIHPAINRHDNARGLHDLVVGTRVATTGAAVLAELGYRVRRYKGERMRARISTWAARSAARYPGRALLVAVRGHALVICDGRVYDTHTPHGASGAAHPFAGAVVVYAALVEPNP